MAISVTQLKTAADTLQTTLNATLTLMASPGVTTITQVKAAIVTSNAALNNYKDAVSALEEDVNSSGGLFI